MSLCKDWTDVTSGRVVWSPVFFMFFSAQALQVNLDSTIYGSFAEIGAGQEAGWSCRSRRCSTFETRERGRSQELSSQLVQQLALWCSQF